MPKRKMDYYSVKWHKGRQKGKTSVYASSMTAAKNKFNRIKRKGVVID